MTTAEWVLLLILGTTFLTSAISATIYAAGRRELEAAVALRAKTEPALIGAGCASAVVGWVTVGLWWWAAAVTGLWLLGVIPTVAAATRATLRLIVKANLR